MQSSQVAIDTSVLVALLNPRDLWRTQALSLHGAFAHPLSNRAPASISVTPRSPRYNPVLHPRRPLHTSQHRIARAADRMPPNPPIQCLQCASVLQ